MAQPFIVVDLAPRARDFQPVAGGPAQETTPCLPRLGAHHIGIKDAHLGPVAAVLRDELVMPRRVLGKGRALPTSRR